MAIAAQRKTTVFSLRLENDIEGLAPIRIVIQTIIAKIAQQLHLHIHDTSTDDRLTCCPVPAGNVAKRVNHGLLPFHRPDASDSVSLTLLIPFSFVGLYQTTKQCLIIAGDGKGTRPRRRLPKKKRARSHKGTEPETLMEPVTGSPRIRFANPLRLRMPAGILARSLRTLRVRLTLAPSQVRFRHIQETGPVPQGNRARNSHGASDRNRTCNPLITNQLRYRCATLAHLALSREACLE